MYREYNFKQIPLISEYEKSANNLQRIFPCRLKPTQLLNAVFNTPYTATGFTLLLITDMLNQPPKVEPY